jgi:hypothetical protein
MPDGSPLSAKLLSKRSRSAVYNGDALYLTPDGTVAASEKPVSAPFCGVSLTSSSAGTADRVVSISPNAIFEAQADGDPGESSSLAGRGADLVLNDGDPRTFVSGHVIDAKTIGCLGGKDIKLHGVFDAPDNQEGPFAILELTILKRSGLIISARPIKKK